MIRVDELPPLDLAATLRPTGSSAVRWGGDEPDPANIPQDIVLTTGIPGGHKTCTCKLARRDDRDWPDLDAFTRILVYGAGRRPAWTGRLTDRPSVSGDTIAISPGAVGMATHLKDNTAFTRVYIDRDLSHWIVNGPIERQAFQYSGGNSLNHIQLSMESGAITFDVSNQALTVADRVEAWYAQPVPWPITRVAATVARTGTFTSLDGANVWASNDIDGDPAESYSITVGTDQFVDLGSGSRSYVYLPFFAAGGVTPPANTSERWTGVAVYGDPILPLQVDDPAPYGNLASDIVKDIILNGAPLLTTTTASVDPTAFTVPHYTVWDPTTPEDAINQLNKFEGADWFVYDDDVFHYRTPMTYGNEWHVNLKQVSFEDEGPKGDEIFNGVVVSYTDVTGQQRLVGPPNSGTLVTSVTLLDSDPRNLANLAGIPRRWARIEIGTSTATGAIRVGEIFLQIMREQHKRRGTVSIRGYARDSFGVVHPAWAVRAGDTVVIDDAADRTPHRIVDTSYSHNNLVNIAGIDALPSKLEKIIERMGVVLVPLGFG